MAGRATRARWAISPPTYMPISRTATWCSRRSRRTVRGTPISLFSLPSLLRTVRFVSRTVAMASFVELLATLPVTPTASTSKRRRQAAARAARAASPSATRITVTSARRPSCSSPSARVTSTHVAPDATASVMYSWPSVRSPGRATNSWPGRTRRESTAAPRIGREPARTMVPAVRAATSAGVRKGSSCGSSPRRSATATGSLTVRAMLAANLPATSQRPVLKSYLGWGRQVERVHGVLGQSSENLMGVGGDRHSRPGGVGDTHRDDDARRVPAHETDEREVEPVRLVLSGCGIPDLRRAGLATDVVAFDEGPTGVPRHRRHHMAHELGQLSGQLLAHGAATRIRRERVAGGHPYDVRAHGDPAVHHRRIGPGELDLGDRYTLAIGPVHEVELGPRLHARVTDDARHLTRDIHAGRLAEAQHLPGVVEHLRGGLRVRPERHGHAGGAHVARVGHDVRDGQDAHRASVRVVDPTAAHRQHPRVVVFRLEGECPALEPRQRDEHLEDRTGLVDPALHGIDEAPRIAVRDLAVCAAVVAGHGRPREDLPAEWIHGHGTREGGLMRGAGREELLLELELEARVGGQLHVGPGHAGIDDLERRGDGPAGRVELGDGASRGAREEGLPALLDPVAAVAFAIDEADELRGERGTGRASGCRKGAYRRWVEADPAECAGRQAVDHLPALCRGQLAGDDGVGPGAADRLACGRGRRALEIQDPDDLLGDRRAAGPRGVGGGRPPEGAGDGRRP